MQHPLTFSPGCVRGNDRRLGRSEADIETSLLCRCGRSRIHVVALARGRGVGRALLEALIASAEAHGIWTLQ